MARLQSKRGAALLLVITVVGLLTFLTVEYMRSSHLEVVSASNLHASLQAQALVRSGATAAQVLLNEDAANSDIDARDEIWYGDAQVIPIGEFAVEVKVEDNMGKFPINHLVYGSGALIGQRDPEMVLGYERLLYTLALDLPPGVTEADLAEAAADWIDEDATTNRYENNADFIVPDTPITHLDELSRVAGYDELDGETFQRIIDHLDTRYDPAATRAKINVNTAEVPVLMSIHDSVPEPDMQQLYDDLTTSPDSGNGPTTNSYIPQNNRTMDVVFESTRFLVKIKTEAAGVFRQAECILERKGGGQGGKRAVPVDWTQY